ncbi:MAG: DUF6273 domain-containing protein [Firmicutes bacterium]|nr:DUF6273 domain-containing protein [Bacillota bacterium]
MTCKNCGGEFVAPKGKPQTECPYCKTDNSANSTSIPKSTATKKGENYLYNAFLQDKSIYENRGRLRNLINDYFAAEPKLRKLMKIAVDDGVADKIIKMLPESINEQKMRIANIAQYFADENQWSPTQFAESVRTLAFGAGVNIEVLDVLANLPTTQPAAVNNPKPPKPPKSNLLAKVGNIITFSNYEWRILDIQNNQALLLSNLILEKHPYNIKDTSVTWEDCSLRYYLNTDFYNKLSDKSQIAQKNIVNDDNPKYGTSGGNNTTDYIFLLSLEEVTNYFGNGKSDMSTLKSNGFINDKNNNKRIARDTSGAAAWWWLRSPGYDSDYAAYVYNDGPVLAIGNVSVVGGVRPALWLNL